MFCYFSTIVLFLPLLTTTKSYELCDRNYSSATCEKLQQIFTSMDDQVDPCNNFYGYACNNWNMTHSGSFDSIQKMVDYQTNLNLISLLEAMAHEPPPLMRFFNLSLVYYQACIKSQGLRPNIREYLNLIKPGTGLEWPLLEDARNENNRQDSGNKWSEDRFDVFSFLGELRSYGLNNVLLDARPYYKGKKIFFLGSASITEPSPNFIAILQELGVSPEISVNYSETLQRIHTDYNASKIAARSFLVKTYHHLQKEYPHLANYIDKTNSYKPIPDGMLIKIEKDLMLPHRYDFSSEEKRNICNYIMIRMLQYFQQDNAGGFSKLHCINDLRNKMDLPVNLLYYENIYKPQQMYYNADIPKFFQTIRDNMWPTLRSSKRMRTVQNETKILLNQITLNMGNIPRKLHGSHINKLFNDIPDLDGENYYRNQLYFFQHRTRMEWDNQLKVLTHKLFTTNDQGQNTARPSYDENLKMMIFPLDILQPPIYHYSYDPIFKWSMLGFIISEVIYHQVLEGLMRPSMAAVEMDMVAFNVAYQAYLQDQQGFRKAKFSGISWQQMFFLNFAQLFCCHNSTSPRDRLNNLVRNSDHFAKAFQC
ncbi:uncharacterized protein LOC142225322 [Haematobia irritans]|uniref:uncharacterized protein LOC142225322 n=1 Tax=Haematobia irritans TaxID=7368 RepID=UPI003F4F9187